MHAFLHQSERDQVETPIGSCGADPHYLHVCYFAAGVSTIWVVSDAPISAQKDIDSLSLEVSRRSIVAASHRIYNASCDIRGSL